MAALLRSNGGAADAPATVPREPQAEDLGEEMGGGMAMGWRPDLQDEVPDAKKPEARRHGSWEHRGACLTVLPDQDGALPDRAVPQLDEKAAHPTMLVVPVSKPDSGAPLQGVSGMEDGAEDSVGGGAEGDGEVEQQVEGPGPPGRWEVQPGCAGLPHHHGGGENSAGHGGRRRK